MEAKDYSKEIHETFFDSKGRKLVQITLNEVKLIEGYLVGFFKGNDQSKTYIIKWHFVEKEEFQNFKFFGPDGVGKLIDQSDITFIKFIG